MNRLEKDDFGTPPEMIWIIFGPNLPDLRIRADPFDEAISMARVIDNAYCGGHVE